MTSISHFHHLVGHYRKKKDKRKTKKQTLRWNDITDQMGLNIYRTFYPKLQTTHTSQESWNSWRVNSILFNNKCATGGIMWEIKYPEIKWKYNTLNPMVYDESIPLVED